MGFFRKYVQKGFWENRQMIRKLIRNRLMIRKTDDNIYSRGCKWSFHLLHSRKTPLEKGFMVNLIGFLEVKAILKREFMVVSSPRNCCFCQIRKALRSLLSASVESQTSSA